MRKLVTLGLLLIIIGLTFNYKEDMLKGYYNYFFNSRKDIKITDRNEYYRDYDFMYLKNTDNFKPSNKQDLINIFYTVINAGKDDFTFYCPKKYKNCINDVKSLAKDQITLSNINNFVHPFNSFKNISTKTDTLGKVNIHVTKSYTPTDIKLVKESVQSIKKEIFNKNLSTEDQLKVIHDYIIDNSKYDSNRTDNNVIEYKSDIAYGPLVEGYGICGGYTDAFLLFLEELNIKSYKISSDSHIWNAVNLYNNWYHIDLTWDDPVTNTGDQIIEHNFFMIDTNKLLKEEKLQHNFNQNVYRELKVQ